MTTAAQPPEAPIDSTSASPMARDCGKCPPPHEAASNDPEVLRAALIRKSLEHRRAECRASMQAEVVKLALDLLVREPDIEGFFGGLAKMMVEESESYTCAVWLIDETEQRCDLWMAYVEGSAGDAHEGRAGAPDGDPEDTRIPLREHGGASLRVHAGVDANHRIRARRSASSRADATFSRRAGCGMFIATPLLLGTRTLGWMTLGSRGAPEPENQWWRVVLIEAVARQAALALHHNRLVERNRREERRKAILEERNRLARDIHDNLAQGFAAILMQLQAAQREAGSVAAGARVEHRDGRRAGAHAPGRSAPIGGRAASERGQRRRHRHGAEAPRRI